MNGRIINGVPSVRAALPQIGKIKIGMKSPKGFPMSVDYFVASGKYAGLFSGVYGDKPQTIQIIFTDNEPQKVCNQLYQYRDNEGKLVAYGDGEVFMVWNGKQYQQYTTENAPDIMEKIAQKKPNKVGWLVTLTLKFIIPKVRGVAGLWCFETRGSVSTIPNIINTFDVINENGGVRGHLFDLSVKFATSQKPDDRSRFPVVSLVLNESEEAINNIKNSLSGGLIQICGNEQKLLNQ